MNGRRIALLGAGEFEDWHAEIDRDFVGETADGPVMIFPLAAAPEGDDVFDSWGSKGLAHYERLGIPAEVVPLKTRADLDRDDVAGALDRAGMVFFSGGNPYFIAQTLEGTGFWQRLCDRVDAGLPYMGCSAGVACLSARTYDTTTDDLEKVFQKGLGYTTGEILFAPHWDTVDHWIPGATRAIAESASAHGETLVALEENTAMVGDGAQWSVSGVGKIRILKTEDWSEYGDGSTFQLPLIRAR